MKNIYLTTLLLSASLLGYGQISFTNSNDRLPNPNAHSGVAIAVLDINGDGLDDIAHLDNGRHLFVEYQNNDNSGFTSQFITQVSDESQWAICAGDVDNNGIVDILTGGSYDDVKLMMANEDGTTFTTSTLPGPGLFVQATNLADINNDGYLDFFSCHDDAESRIWGNDGNGNLEMADHWIDMSTDPPSDNSGNYGSIWTDIDNDGDLDLYIAKCRQGVNNPADPRRINALFINDNYNSYSEKADTANLKIGHQSWTADFQDVDNDGDMDCFITNHDAPSQLLINDGNGIFTDTTATSGINVLGLPVQGVMRDFDNDGFVDIVVAGSRHHLFRNNGDLTFTEVPNMFNSDDMESFAIGDLNHDGYLDIYGGYANIYTNPSNIADVLWLNDGGDHHFLTVNLVGTTSNRSGVGARLEIYGEWGMQIREVRAGESYGITNSLASHFGLGESTSVDSLIIRWPSGTIDKYLDLAGDQFLTIIENTCVSPAANVEVVGQTTICSGETVELSAPEGFNYIWSNGATDRTIAVGDEGAYSVTISDESSCFGVSQAINVTVDPDETPSIEALGDTKFCQGGAVLLSASEASSYLWSSGGTGQTVEVTESGAYTVAVQGQCETFESEAIIVNVLSAPQPIVEDIQIAEDSVVIQLTGNNLYWYDDPSEGLLVNTGDEAIIPIAGDTSFVYFVENRLLYPGNVYLAGMSAHEGTPYSGNVYNGGLIFDCFSPFLLRSVTVITDTEGQRIIELQDADGNVLQTATINIPVGETVLDINFAIEPGTDYLLTTNTENNQMQFGYNSARLQRSSENVSFPYVIDDLLSIKDSNFGSNRYYYWFNWQVREPDFNCVSERVAVEVVVVDTDDLFQSRTVQVHPNPTDALLRVNLPGVGEEVRLRLLNMNGQVVLQKVSRLQQPELDLSQLPAGTYWLEVLQNGEVLGTRIIKH